MSVRVMAKVWETSRLSGSALLTLLAIADNANDEGVAFPSQARIAAKTRMSERQVRSIIKKIEASGELLVTKERSGRFFRNRYRIVLSPGKDFLLTGESTGNLASIQPEVATSDESSVEPSLKPSGLNDYESLERLLEWAERDLDDNGTTIRAAARGLPEAATARVLEGVQGKNPRNRAAYVVQSLKAERALRDG